MPRAKRPEPDEFREPLNEHDAEQREYRPTDDSVRARHSVYDRMPVIADVALDRMEDILDMKPKTAADRNNQIQAAKLVVQLTKGRPVDDPSGSGGLTGEERVALLREELAETTLSDRLTLLKEAVAALPAEEQHRLMREVVTEAVG